MSNPEESSVTTPQTLVDFRNAYSGANALVEGLEFLVPEEQIATLLERFRQSKFKWTGDKTNFDVFLKAGGDCTGDCNTIATAFVETAKAVGFTDAAVKTYPALLTLM